MRTTWLQLVVLSLTFACTTAEGDPLAGDPPRVPGDGTSGDGAPSDSLTGDSGPPEITLDIAESCAALVPCGGNEVGTWYVSDVCVEQAVLFADLFTYCPSAQIADIPAAPASGVVTFTGSWVERQATAAITADILVPFACGYCLCGVVDGALDSAGLDAVCGASCNGNNECECTIQAELVIDEAGSYTVDGNTITIGNGQTFDYCVSGNQLRYVETTATSQEPGVYTLTRQ